MLAVDDSCHSPKGNTFRGLQACLPGPAYFLHHWHYLSLKLFAIKQVTTGSNCPLSVKSIVISEVYFQVEFECLGLLIAELSSLLLLSLEHHWFWWWKMETFIISLKSHTPLPPHTHGQGWKGGKRQPMQKSKCVHACTHMHTHVYTFLHTICLCQRAHKSFLVDLSSHKN